MIDKVPLTWRDMWGWFFLRMFAGVVIAAIVVIVCIIILEKITKARANR